MKMSKSYGGSTILKTEIIKRQDDFLKIG